MRAWMSITLAVLALAPAPPAAAQASLDLRAVELRGLDIARIGRVILAERVPPEWLRDDADDWPLQPARQRRRMPRECRTRGGYRRFCQGERRVPTPFGVAAALAQHLGLGQRATATQVMHHPPFDEWLAAIAHVGNDPRLTFPVPVGHMGRGFGYTRDAGLRHRRHQGVDIGAPEGSEIVSARDGLVVYADNGITGMGNTVIVLHRDGFSTLYAHCQELTVFAGQIVSRGQRIARVGETGFANAPHLHFEWRQRGWVRDPSRHFIPREPAPG